MGSTGKSGETTPSRHDDKPKKKKPHLPIEDDDIEDGDIATPKRDRNDEDDRPL
jgi:hypothetical protein